MVGAHSLKYEPYVCQFLIDSLLLEFSCSRIPQVCNELYQPTHIRIVPRAPATQESRRRRGRHDGGRLEPSYATACSRSCAVDKVLVPL